MTTLKIIMLSMGVTLILFIVLFLLINSTRNFFTKSRYIRILTFTDDKGVLIKHVKKNNFNHDNLYIINPNHIFMFKGYTSLLFTQHSNENINPLDFESKFEAEIYTSAIQNKLIEQTFSTLKVNKLDSMKILIILNLATLGILAYMIMKSAGIM